MSSTIFQRALRRELHSTAGAVFTTLFSITVTVMLIKILGRAATGRVSSQDVIALIAFQSLNYLPVILILTGFISVLLVVTRSYQDSEMVVWFSSGVSLTKWIQPILKFSVPIIALIIILSFFATPWANQKSSEFQERFAKREDIARVSPGNFEESAKANRIFFVEGFSDDATKVRNIFINTVEKDGSNSLVLAKSGEVTTDEDGDKYVVLENGHRYDGFMGKLAYEITEFKQYGIFVDMQQKSESGNLATRAMSTTELLQDANPHKMGELLWRISLPLMALSLMLLAIPLSFVNPRAGRSIGLIIAILIAFAYSNIVSIFQASVSQSKLAFGVAWWPIHVILLLIVFGLFMWRLKINSRYHPLVLWGHLRRSFKRK